MTTQPRPPTNHRKRLAVSGKKGKKAKRAQSLPPLAPAKRPLSTRMGVVFFEAFVFAVSALPLGIVLYCGYPLWLALIAGAYLVIALMTAHITQQWEKVVVLRLGRFNRVEGPGIFFTIPFLESAALRVDQRITVTPFSAEKALTADLVPTDIDAVLFWMVVSPEKAWCEVDNYPAAVSWSAQTALRDAIGSINLADISTRRSQLDAELREVLNAKTSDWGIAILSVEIRNILIPESLQDAMSREAQAQQESNARLILAEIEHQVAELYLEAAKLYRQDDLAFQVRMASMVNESVKEGGNNLIVVPSSFSEGFNAGSMQDLKDMLGK